MNYIWAGMLLIGIVYSAFHGTIPQVTEAALDSAKDAVSLCITMTGIMAVWVGLMEIAKQTGLIDSLTRKLYPFLRFMFPSIPKDHDAMKHIATNTIANILGLGWAATPAGLKAMDSLAALEEERGNPEYMLREKHGKAPKTAGERTASKEMCNFLILNISSLQLIPVNIIAYRSQYGSVNPTSIVVPAIIATAVSTLAGIAFCKMMDSAKRNPR